jgi:hypothetical protein
MRPKAIPAKTTYRNQLVAGLSFKNRLVYGALVYMSLRLIF